MIDRGIKEATTADCDFDPCGTEGTAPRPRARPGRPPRVRTVADGYELRHVTTGAVLGTVRGLRNAVDTLARWRAFGLFARIA